MSDHRKVSYASLTSFRHKKSRPRRRANSILLVIVSALCVISTDFDPPLEPRVNRGRGVSKSDIVIGIIAISYCPESNGALLGAQIALSSQFYIFFIPARGPPPRHKKIILSGRPTARLLALGRRARANPS